MPKIEFDFTDPDNPAWSVDGHPVAGLSDDVLRQARQLEKKGQAQVYAEARRERHAFRQPPTSASLAAELRLPDPQHVYRVDQLMPQGGNVLFTAGFKVGKTTLLFALAKALADQEAFLRRFAITPPRGRVGIWNYEMTDVMVRRWTREMAFRRPDRVVCVHFRHAPQRPNLAAKVWKEWTIDWLRRNDVSVWMLDPAAVAIAPFGEENDNGAVVRFTDTLDEIKAAAEVDELVITAHTGRREADEGQERARGASRWEDWADALWYATKDKGGTRYLRALGRDVEVEATELHYQPPTRRYVALKRTRTQKRAEEAVVRAVQAVSTAGDGAPTEEVAKAIGGAKSGEFTPNRALQLAEDRGYVRREQSGRVKACFLTPSGTTVAERGYDPTTPDPLTTPDNPRGGRT